MTALTKNVTRKVEQSPFEQLSDNFGSGVVNVSAEIFQGALCMYDTSDDTIKPGAASTTGVALGVANYYVPAGSLGEAGIRSGVFPFANSAAADEISNDDAGSICYIVDDDTVALTDGSSSRSVAGKIVRVDSEGVWVRVSPYI